FKQTLKFKILSGRWRTKFQTAFLATESAGLITPNAAFFFRYHNAGIPTLVEDFERRFELRRPRSQHDKRPLFGERPPCFACRWRLATQWSWLARKLSDS